MVGKFTEKLLYGGLLYGRKWQPWFDVEAESLFFYAEKGKEQQ